MPGKCLHHPRPYSSLQHNKVSQAHFSLKNWWSIPLSLSFAMHATTSYRTYVSYCTKYKQQKSIMVPYLQIRYYQSWLRGNLAQKKKPVLSFRPTEAQSGQYVLLLVMLQLSKPLLQSKLDSTFFNLWASQSTPVTQVEQNITPMRKREGKAKRGQFRDKG